MAQVETSDGDWVSETWPGGTLPAPQLDGDTADYSNILPGVDLHLTATANGMSEVLVIQNATAAANPALSNLELTMPNATVSVNAQQTTVAKAADQSTVTSAPPTWWDSSQKGANDEGPGGAGEPQPLPHTTDSDSVNLDVGAVADQAPQYPLYVDPDWSPVQQAYWFTDRAYPDQSYLNGNQSAGYQSVGWANQNGITYLSRAFWQFDTAPVDGNIIENATLDVPISYSCASTPIQLWTYGPATAGFTWNSDPGDWNNLVDTVNPVSANGCNVSDTLQFNAKSGIASYAAANMTHVQFGIRASDESGDVTSRKHLGQNATLTIAYDTPPNTPSSLQFTGPPRACGTSVATAAWINNNAQAIVVQATQSDPDSGTTLKTLFQVSKAASLGTPVGTAETDAMAQGPVSYTYPENDFANNTNYAIRAETYDSYAFSAWTPWCYFTIADTQPPLPSVTLSPANPTVGQVVIATITAPTSSIRGFVSWFTPNRVEADQTQDPVQAVKNTTGYHDCAVAATGATYTCNTTGTTTIKFTATEPTGAFYVASLDRAGNISSGTGSDGQPTVAKSATILANFDKSVNLQTGGHSWIGDGTSATSIPDNNHTAGNSTVDGQALSLGSGITPLAVNTQTNAPAGSRPALTEGPSTATDFYFSGTSPIGTPATTTGPVMDQTSSFSISAWLAPTQVTTASQTMTAVAQLGAAGPAFSLQQAGGSWQFCLKSQNSAVQQCVSTASGTVAAGAFTFVTGIWDASSDQMTIALNGSLEDPDNVTIARTPIAGDSASTGKLVIGSASSSGTSNAWAGDIVDVSVIPGVPASSQLGNLKLDGDPSS